MAPWWPALALAAALWMAGCAPNPQKQFDAACGNDLECMGWYATDFCDDGQDVTFKFFSLWRPGVSWGPYTTPQLAKYGNGVVKCQSNEPVCIGGYTPERQWGAGADGGRACGDCCGTCNGISYKFYFNCGQGKDPV